MEVELILNETDLVDSTSWKILENKSRKKFESSTKLKPRIKNYVYLVIYDCSWMVYNIILNA